MKKSSKKCLVTICLVFVCFVSTSVLASETVEENTNPNIVGDEDISDLLALENKHEIKDGQKHLYEMTADEVYCELINAIHTLRSDYITFDIRSRELFSKLQLNNSEYVHDYYLTEDAFYLQYQDLMYRFQFKDGKIIDFMILGLLY